MRDVNLPVATLAPHLRVGYSGDVDKLLNKILPCKFSETDYSLSGSFDTEILTIKAQIPGAKVGDQIYFVHAARKTGTIPTNELAPDRFGMAGDTITKSSFQSRVEASIKKAKVDTVVKGFLRALLDASTTPSGLIKSEALKSITKSDVGAITKDFGELSGALWFMTVHEPKVKSITYPSSSNHKLIDYFANLNANEKIALSAKSHKSPAPPSIESLAEIMRHMHYSDHKKESARKVVIEIAEKDVINGILSSAKLLENRGYEWLKKNIFHGDFTGDDCEKLLAPYKNAESLMGSLQGYYAVTGHDPKMETAKQIIINNGKRYGLIISPLGYAVVDQLNASQEYLSVLNDATKQIKVTQIFMKISPSANKVSYEVKEFDSSDFKFKYISNAAKPTAHKIAFTMLK